METIIQHSITRAADDAVKLWALASSQYPKENGLILSIVSNNIIEVTSAFALNARRSLEVLPPNQKYKLAQPRWQWAPINNSEIINDLWDALNQIVHAKKLDVGFEELPSEVAVISGGALVVPYIRAATDRKKLALIDPFALSHAFLYDVFPKLISGK